MKVDIFIWHVCVLEEGDDDPHDVKDVFAPFVPFTIFTSCCEKRFFLLFGRYQEKAILLKQYFLFAWSGEAIKKDAKGHKGGPFCTLYTSNTYPHAHTQIKIEKRWIKMPQLGQRLIPSHLNNDPAIHNYSRIHFYPPSVVAKTKKFNAN